jgi:hypothetical protein
VCAGGRYALTTKRFVVMGTLATGVKGSPGGKGVSPGRGRPGSAALVRQTGVRTVATEVDDRRGEANTGGMGLSHRR